MSIETEINRISTNVSNTLSAVSEMGGEVPEDATSDDMASGVRSIPVGAKIDDTTPSTSTTYSSSKIESEISKLNEANAAQNTEIAKKANDSDLAKVAKSGSYNDLTGKPTIPTVPSTLPNPNALTFTGAVNETYDGSAAKSVAIPSVPESLKNPNKLIFTGAVTAEYDGSAEVSVEIPAGGGSEYTLPVASATQLGGVKAVAATDEMTDSVGITADGFLKVKPGGSGNGTLTITTLASGSIATGSATNTEIDTGVSYGEMIKHRFIRIRLYSTEEVNASWYFGSVTQTWKRNGYLSGTGYGGGGLVFEVMGDGLRIAEVYSGSTGNKQELAVVADYNVYVRTAQFSYTHYYRTSDTAGTLKLYTNKEVSVDWQWSVQAIDC